MKKKIISQAARDLIRELRRKQSPQISERQYVRMARRSFNPVVKVNEE